MKKPLLLIAFIVVGVAYLIIANTFYQNSNDEKLDEQVGKTVTTTALQVSGLDVSALENISENLQSTCAKNKYELTEAECVQAIKDHKDNCMRLITEKFPEQLVDSDHKQMIIANYVDCLFQQ